MNRVVPERTPIGFTDQQLTQLLATANTLPLHARDDFRRGVASRLDQQTSNIAIGYGGNE